MISWSLYYDIVVNLYYDIVVTLYYDIVVTLCYICLAEQRVILITQTPEIYAAPPCRSTLLSHSWLIFVMG
jgi:hypothetical protein